MGEYADLFINGTVDQYTGELIDGDSPGYPRSRKSPVFRIIKCDHCNKKFKTEQGRKDHVRDTHQEHTVVDRNESDRLWAEDQTTVGEEQDFGV